MKISAFVAITTFALLTAVGASAQPTLPTTMPACSGLQSAVHYCKTVDLYAKPKPAGEGDLERLRFESEQKAYERRMADGIVTLDEVAVGEVFFDRTVSRESYSLKLRSLWLELNGLPEDQSSESVFPEGPIEIAIARRTDTVFPPTTPICEGENPHQNCMSMGILENFFPDGAAVYSSVFSAFWSDFPSFEHLLEMNGLIDTGITLFSYVPPGWYNGRFAN